MSRTHKTNRAFTVIELLAICLILLVLISSLVANYKKSFERTKGALAVDNLNNIRNAEILFANEPQNGAFTKQFNDLEPFGTFDQNDQFWKYSVAKVVGLTFNLQAQRLAGEWKNGTITMDQTGTLTFRNAGGAVKTEWPPQ